MAANFQIRQGETLTLKLDRLDGDISIVSTVLAQLKKAGPNGSVPSSSAPYVATFETFTVPNGWDFLLSDELTQLLDPGIYVADAKLNLVDGGVLKTDAVTVEVRPSVTV